MTSFAIGGTATLFAAGHVDGSAVRSIDHVAGVAQTHDALVIDYSDYARTGRVTETLNGRSCSGTPEQVQNDLNQGSVTLNC